MKRGREEKSHETSLLSTRRCHGRMSTSEIDIPLDLTVEILKKLPAKSLVRFQCVSKLWSSIISSCRDFIDSIVTRSLTQPPRDAHLITDYKTECFLVIPSSCPRNTRKESVSILSLAQDYVRGLFFGWSRRSDEGVIYNPTTRQSFNLPKNKHSCTGICFFGYDPLENQYKVLIIPRDRVEKACQVFTLGDPTAKQWRNIQGSNPLFPSLGLRSNVSISGAIYFLVETTTFEYKLLSFDVRSEKFYHVDTPETLTLMDRYYWRLINYQGKLGLICCEECVEIWVMEDAEKRTQRWSMIFFYEMKGFENWTLLDVTRGGEIVFSNKFYMLRIFYYDPKRNSVRYVDLAEKFAKERRGNKSYFFTRTFPDYVENTMSLY